MHESANGSLMSKPSHTENSGNWFTCLEWTRSLGLAGNLGSWHRNERDIR